VVIRVTHESFAHSQDAEGTC